MSSENGEHWTERLGDVCILAVVPLAVLALLAPGWL